MTQKHQAHAVLDTVGASNTILQFIHILQHQALKSVDGGYHMRARSKGPEAEGGLVGRGLQTYVLFVNGSPVMEKHNYPPGKGPDCGKLRAHRFTTK